MAPPDRNMDYAGHWVSVTSRRARAERRGCGAMQPEAESTPSSQVLVEPIQRALARLLTFRSCAFGCENPADWRSFPAEPNNGQDCASGGKIVSRSRINLPPI